MFSTPKGSQWRIVAIHPYATCVKRIGAERGGSKQSMWQSSLRRGMGYKQEWNS